MQTTKFSAANQRKLHNERSNWKGAILKGTILTEAILVGAAERRT